jgi:hypothetical protein
MTTYDFVTELFVRVDDAMIPVKKHSQARLHPSEIVTLGLLFALKGSGNRAFYRWAERDLRPLFPNLPERTRLFRLLTQWRAWTSRLLSSPTLLGLVDCYGIELIHPRREGRSNTQIGRKGKSNHRWIVGAKLCFVLNRFGLVVAYDLDTANVHDTRFHPLIAAYAGPEDDPGPFCADPMLIFGDSGFHAKTTPERADPPNLKICGRGQWNPRMLVETLLSMLTGVCRLKKVAHRTWSGLRTRVAYVLAMYNFLVQWNGLQADETGFVPLSIARFSL